MIPLTKSEIETPRTAAELHPWVMSKLEELSATEEGKLAIRMSKGLAKELVEESFPLGHFAKHYFNASPQVLITQKIGSQSYDARISDDRKNPSGLQYVEVTQAHEGENGHLRMVMLQEEGHVSALGAVRKEGTKRRRRKIVVENEAKSHSEIVEEQLSRIAAAVSRKSEKNYPDHTALVIIFEDFIVFKNSEDLTLLRDWARQNLISRLPQFEVVSLVGASGDTHFAFGPGATAI